MKMARVKMLQAGPRKKRKNLPISSCHTHARREEPPPPVAEAAQATTLDQAFCYLSLLR